MIIKKYEEKYRKDVQKICLLTGPGDAICNKKVGDYILATYCNYYLDNEFDNCFVLVDDSDIARGYILCSENFTKFAKGSMKYLSSFSEAGFSNAIECRGEILGHMLFSKKYPAHLHINIEDGYRGGGNGSKMISTLVDHLKSKGIHGVCLIVDFGNVEARRFYEKNGFSNGMNFFNRGLLMKRKI